MKKKIAGKSIYSLSKVNQHLKSSREKLETIQNIRIVVVGPPGSGKTSLCKMLVPNMKDCSASMPSTHANKDVLVHSYVFDLQKGQIECSMTNPSDHPAKRIAHLVGKNEQGW